MSVMNMETTKGSKMNTIQTASTEKMSIMDNLISFIYCVAFGQFQLHILSSTAKNGSIIGY